MKKLTTIGLIFNSIENRIGSIQELTKEIKELIQEKFHLPEINEIQEYITADTKILGKMILDDYNDIVRGEESLGKSPGQDLVAGDITLPLINLLQTASKSEKKRLIDILQSKRGRNAFQEIKEIFIDSKAADLTFKTALSYIKKAKRKLGKLENSDYKNSLVSLADYITGRNFSAL